MTPPKILIVGTDMMNIYNHRLELIKAMLSIGYNVIVAAPRGGEEKALIEMGVKFVDTHVDNRGTSIKRDLKLLKDLISVIRREQPDIVLTFYTKTNIYGGLACRIAGVPYIENITGLGSAVSRGGFMQKLMVALYGMAVKDAEMVFFQNDFNLKFFQDHHISMKKWKMLPGSGVNLKRYQPLDYPDNDKYEFVFISRVIKEKGIEEYVSAAENVKKEYPEAVFHVIGPAAENYRQFLLDADKKGIIKNHGKTFDVKPYILRSHCMVFPSYYAEGMANVLLECAASARPLITTPCPGCGETVEDNVTGYVVQPKDVEELTQKLFQFIRLPNERKREMGLAGRLKMEREFNRDIVVDAYIREINRILSER